MEIYKGLLVTNEPGPENIIYEDKKYYRYMDRCYTPQVPASLAKDDVKALSEIRLKLADEIIDLEYSLMIVNSLYSIINESKKTGCVIDFGCGGGILGDLFVIKNHSLKAPSNIIGLDISDYAVKSAKHNYLQSFNSLESTALVFDEDTVLAMENESVDSIISSFVMHFNIYDHQIKELYRVLKPGGIFVYNDYVYHKYKGHFKSVISNLEKHGFTVENYNKSFIHPHGNDIKNHRFVIARK